MQILNRFRLVFFALGLAGFVASQRYLRFETYYWYVLAISLLLLLGAACIPVVNLLRCKKEAKTAEAYSWGLVGVWQLAIIAGVGVFIGYQALLGSAGVPESLFSKALLAVWLLCFVLGIAAGVGIEVAHANAGVGVQAEPKRVRRSAYAWLMVGLCFAALVSFNYVGAKRDKVYDWSYLKTSTPSESTIAILKTSPNPVEAHIFFPYDNEVRPSVASYFEYLVSKNANIRMFAHDKELEPSIAEELKVSRNGTVVFRMGDKRERIDVGLDMAGARATLKKLDVEVQKQVLRLTSNKKKVYFTRGHGEYTWSGSTEDQMRSIDLFEALLRSQNYTVASISMAEGSANAIPDDADAVVIVANDAPFVQQEVDALWRYLEKGGRLAVFLDPANVPKETPTIVQNQADPLLAMLNKTGLKFEKKLLANDRNFIQATRSQADHWFIFSNSFSSHETVANLSRNEDRAMLFGFQVGYFDVQPQTAEWRATTTVRSLADSFVDENRNTKFDPNEKRQTYSMGAVAFRVVNTTDKDGKAIDTDARIVAYADATAVSDALLRNRANALYVVDSLKWLTGQVDTMGEASSEEDVKIQHTNKEDAIWFNGTIVLVPALILVAGFFATRKRRKSGGGR